MKKTTSFFTKITLGLGIVTILSSLSMAAAPLYINYQGKLTNDRGEPVNEEVLVTFNLWAGPSGGSAILTEPAIRITPDNGVFTHPIKVDPADLFSTYSEVYLSVTLGGTELLPRQKLVSVPYAMAVATGSVGTLELANNSVTGDKLAAMTMPIDVVATSIASSVKINANQINDGALPYTVIASSVAVDAVRGAQIKDGEVTGADIKDLSVDAGDLKNDAVTSEKIPNGAVTKEKLNGTDLKDVFKTKGDERLILGNNYYSAVCNTEPSVKYYECGGSCGEDTKPNSCTNAEKIGRIVVNP